MDGERDLFRFSDARASRVSLIDIQTRDWLQRRQKRLPKNLLPTVPRYLVEVYSTLWKAIESGAPGPIDSRCIVDAYRALGFDFDAAKLHSFLCKIQEDVFDPKQVNMPVDFASFVMYMCTHHMTGAHAPGGSFPFDASALQRRRLLGELMLDPLPPLASRPLTMHLGEKLREISARDRSGGSGAAPHESEPDVVSPDNVYGVSRPSVADNHQRATGAQHVGTRRGSERRTWEERAAEVPTVVCQHPMMLTAYLKLLGLTTKEVMDRYVDVRIPK
jgi:hypothetical protein